MKSKRLKPKSMRQDTGLLASLLAPDILNSMADGVYVTDANRQIVFWNWAAERITGWTVGEVVGKSCFDNVLIHEDKDGHRLCGEEFCPLHRAILTDRSSPAALLVYAQTKSGKRVPVEVSVAPIHDETGQVVGGIEVFRDLSASEEDLRCAQLIQQHSLAAALPEDPRFQFGIRYVPRDLVGGDFYRLEAVAPAGYACMVADVMGHGVSAALYTMQLRALWEEFRPHLSAPARFFEKLNARLHLLAHDNDYFATGFFFHLDAASGAIRYVNAGHPDPIILRKNGKTVFLSEHGPGLGLFEPVTYPESQAQLEAGDTLVVYTDGAVEIFNEAGDEMQETGLASALVRARVGAADFNFDLLEAALLKFSASIRFPDDLTILRVHRSG
jgi:PAS domain S-box-containing protein